jgi:hypothetical protein
MRRALAAAALLLSAGFVFAQATPAPPSATPKPKPKTKTQKPPLDFSGVWVLDAQASSGVISQMENAVLEVRQNGNRIWIDQIESRRHRILSEEIVVDGRKYEKSLGAGQKGTLEADWGKDGETLWLQAVAGQEGDPKAAVQRMIWRLRDGGKVWTRQTRTIQPGGVKDTFLVFRKRETEKKP